MNKELTVSYQVQLNKYVVKKFEEKSDKLTFEDIK